MLRIEYASCGHDEMTAYRYLLAAVIYQAIKDASQRGYPARRHAAIEWLNDPATIELARSIDIEMPNYRTFQTERRNGQRNITGRP